MLKYFNYRKSNDEEFDNIVECTLDLARATYENKKSDDYKEKNAQVLNALGKKCVEGTRFEAMFEEKGLAVFNNPNVKNNQTVREMLNAVIAQVTTAIVPEVVNDTFSGLIAEIHQVGYGETARFIIESNDLFKVNSKAEGIRKGVDQPLFNEEITVVGSPVEISVSIDWYPFVAGIMDLGQFTMRIAKSFMAYIFLKTVKGMTQASVDFGAAYNTNGVTPALWGTLRERVQAANGGMNVIAVGTAVALSSVSLQGNFQVEIGEEMNKVGYLDQYLGVPLIALNNVLVPGTTNGTADLVLDDRKIFMIPVAGTRPVKILFEGDEVSVAFDPEHTSDKRYGVTITYIIGVEAIISSKIGTVTI